MGTVNASWSEQVWNDPNCRLNLSWDTLKNDANWFYDRYIYVNDAEIYADVRSLAANIPIPGSQSWRYPANTKFQQIIRCLRDSDSAQADSANWGPGYFPYPPTPPGAAAPSISAALVARNTWDITVWGGGTHHRIYVADSANGEPIYANVAGTATYRYAMPVGVRSATIRGRGVNIGPYGAEGPVADSFYGLSSSNTAPGAPTSIGATPSRLLAGQAVNVSWTHNDVNADPQVKYQIAYKKIGGPGALGTIQEQAVVTSAQGTTTLTVPGPGKYEVYVRTWDWEGNPGSYSVAATFEVVRTLVRESGLWVPATEQVKVSGVWMPTVKLKL